MKTSIFCPALPLSFSLPSQPAATSHQLGIVFMCPVPLPACTNDIGWGGTEIYLGLTFAMLMMARSRLYRPPVGWSIGGQRVVFIGSLTIAASCLAMSQADSLIFWYVHGYWPVSVCGWRYTMRCSPRWLTCMVNAE